MPNMERKGLMSFIGGLLKVAAGAGAGVLAITALPIFGAVGTITAAGAVVGSLIGGGAGLADEWMNKDKKEKSK